MSSVSARICYCATPTHAPHAYLIEISTYTEGTDVVYSFFNPQPQQPFDDGDLFLSWTTRNEALPGFKFPESPSMWNYADWGARVLFYLEATFGSQYGIRWEKPSPKYRFGMASIQIDGRRVKEMFEGVSPSGSEWIWILPGKSRCISRAPIRFEERLGWRIERLRRLLLRPLMRVRRRLFRVHVVARRWVARLYNPHTPVGHWRCLRNWQESAVMTRDIATCS